MTTIKRERYRTEVEHSKGEVTDFAWRVGREG